MLFLIILVITAMLPNANTVAGITRCHTTSKNMSKFNAAKVSKSRNPVPSPTPPLRTNRML